MSSFSAHIQWCGTGLTLHYPAYYKSTSLCCLSQCVFCKEISLLCFVLLRKKKNRLFPCNVLYHTTSVFWSGLYLILLTLRDTLKNNYYHNYKKKKKRESLTQTSGKMKQVKTLPYRLLISLSPFPFLSGNIFGVKEGIFAFVGIENSQEKSTK